MKRKRKPSKPPPLKLRPHRRRLPSLRLRRRANAIYERVVMPAVTPTAVLQPVTATDDALPAAAAAAAPTRPRKAPLYWRLLRLRHIHPNGWQRALLAEGVLAVAVLLVLAQKATIWTLLVLPVVVAALVKVHDMLTGSLGGTARSDSELSRDGGR
jgi:hypothetical protein